MVHEETRKELVKNAIGLCRDLGKDLANYVATSRRLEREHELEKQIVEAQQRAATQPATDAGHTREAAAAAATTTPSPTPADIEAEIDDMMNEEECTLCVDLLRELKKRPTREQVRGLKEYGEFMGELREGSDPEQLRAALRETDVLQPIFEDKLMA